ncbi:wax ester/triacylglycerol synthase family O-acyltransferase [Spongiibacter taiwanensis]
MDAAWLYVEKKAAPAHFGPLLFMRCPEGEPDFVQTLSTHWRRHRQFAPPFNYCLADSLVPRWQVLADSELDMEYHFRHSALPAPGGEQELGILVSRLHSQPLDRSRPLWQCYLIEGLAGNRFAIYLKLHHAQIDGMGAAKLMARCFTTDPAARNMAPPWSVGPRGARTESVKPNPRDKPRPKLTELLGSGARQVNQVSTALRTLSLQAYLKRKHDLYAPYQGPKSVLNARISLHRRYATQRFALADLKAVAKAGDAKVNDVFLAVIGGALRRYLLEFALLPRLSLVGQIPVNIRPADDDGLGNALSFAYAPLGTDIADPVERLRAVERSTASSKVLQSHMGRDALQAYTAIVLAPYITEAVLNLGGHFRPAANLVISNIQGPDKWLYFNGAKVEHIYGPSVLFHGQALNITLASYVDEVNIGFTACRDRLPSMQKIAVYTGEELTLLARQLKCSLPSAKEKATKS